MKVWQPRLQKKKKKVPEATIPSVPGFKPPEVPDLAMPEFIPPKRAKRPREETRPSESKAKKQKLNPPMEKPSRAPRKYGPRDLEPPPVTGKRKGTALANSVLRRPPQAERAVTRRAVQESGLRKPQALRAGSAAPKASKIDSKLDKKITEKPVPPRSASTPQSFYVGT